MSHRAAAALAFISGFVALGYEILWARRLSDVIGATALASSLVVGVFFVMLAAGAVFLGPLASRVRSPWRLYALLELGILLTILPSFFGEKLAGVVARGFGEALLRPGSSLLMKALLALVFVGPASFLMGGTLPAMGQAVVRAGRLGREGNVLYGINTLGGAAGILITTFALLPALGMRRSFLALMSGSIVLAGLALWFSRMRVRASAAEDAAVSDVPDLTSSSLPNGTLNVPNGSAPSVDESADRTLDGHASSGRIPASTWAALAFVSGFNVLGLEILSLHLFSQVLHNSTYTFATVLVVVIAALAMGALVTQRWRLDEAAALRRLGIVLLVTGIATAVVPRLFFEVTQLQPLGGGVATLGGYVVRILAVATLVLGPPFVLAGWVFPIVLAGAGSAAPESPAAASVARASGGIGESWGRLLGINAVGALLGLVFANFVCMRFLGLWLSLAVWSLIAIVAGLLVVLQTRERRLPLALGGVAVLLLIVAFPRSLPLAALAPGDAILAWCSGPDGVATVVANSGVQTDRRIKWNNTYTLGGVANTAQQARMGQLALLLHPRPHHVGYIGLATGITASSALRDPVVQKATAVELSPQITALACQNFADANLNLCASPRVRVVVEDGRLFFGATRDRYDVVVGDLFVPWQAGTANLYTREQFEAVRDHLTPGGLFAQWLPLFQLDAVGFFGIAATFAAVFPNAWLAIADFQPYNPALALIGWRDANGAPSRSVIEARCREVQPLGRLREPMLADATGVAAFLVGPVAGFLPPDIPLMTLDRPWLGDHAPRVQRARPERWFQGPPLVAYLERVASAVADDSLRADIERGQKLYRFCEILEREGPERAAVWFEANMTEPLPATNFAVEQATRMNWPFPRDAGMFLLSRPRTPRP